MRLELDASSPPHSIEVMAMKKSPILVTALLALACSDQLVEPEFIYPELQDLRIRQIPFRFQGDWSVKLRAELANPDLRPPENARISIRLRIGSSDTEEMVLRPEYCGDIDKVYFCTEFNLTMESGRHINELRPRLHEIPARFAFVHNDGSWGSMWILEGELQPAMKHARLWPGVESTEVSLTTPQHWYGDPTFPSMYMVAIALVDFGTPILGDGIIQAGAGDSLVASYTQPDGQALEASSVMCEQPQGTGFAIAGLGEVPPCG
jgi:hypothetical protein